MNINNPTTFGTPSLTLSTSNSSGTAGALRADDTILVYDATVPTTISYGASAAAGSASVTARRDHTHGMAAADAVAQADQTETEAESNVDKYIPPDLIHFSPGIAKAWAKWEQTEAHGLEASYNYTSVTDGGDEGETDHLVATDFSSANYVIVATCVTHVLGAFVYVTQTPAQAAGGFTTVTREHDGTRIDTTNFVCCFGDQ